MLVGFVTEPFLLNLVAGKSRVLPQPTEELCRCHRRPSAKLSRQFEHTSESGGVNEPAKYKAYLPEPQL